MALSLISHLLHPHSDVPNIDLNEPLAGALLVSPWVSFATTDDSVQRNMYSDYVTAPASKRWSSSFLGKHNNPFSGGCVRSLQLRRIEVARQLQSANTCGCLMVPRH